MVTTKPRLSTSQPQLVIPSALFNETSELQLFGARTVLVIGHDVPGSCSRSTGIMKTIIIAGVGIITINLSVLIMSTTVIMSRNVLLGTTVHLVLSLSSTCSLVKSAFAYFFTLSLNPARVLHAEQCSHIEDKYFSPRFSNQKWIQKLQNT